MVALCAARPDAHRPGRVGDHGCDAAQGAGKSWFWRGTLGLCILNAGIAVFGDAVKERALLDWEQK
ncbi:MAG: hypothetical protein R2873_14390 [Caldilineaceae bacterium]